MTHQYKQDRLNLKEVNYLRWAIPDLEMMLDIVPHWAKECVRLRLDEHKLLYKEITQRPYRSIEELRNAIDQRGVI